MELHFFSAAHPTISAGNQSNLAAAADLSEATLETILTNIQKITDDRGILIGASAVSLHIPVDSWAIADRVLSSPGNTQTSAAAANPNNNAINATRHLGMLPDGYYINRRFTDTDAYFVKTDVPNGAKMFKTVLHFRPRWSQTSILVIFGSRHGSVIALVFLIGVVTSVAQVN